MNLKCFIHGHKYKFHKVLREGEKKQGALVTGNNCRLTQNICIRCGKLERNSKYLKKWNGYTGPIK